MGKRLEVIESGNAPEAVGPYSQAVAAGEYVFVSGQLGIEVAGELVGGGIRGQAARALDNIKAVLEAGGLGLSDIVKTTVYMKDLAQFAEMNEVYAGRFLPGAAPARETVGVAALPKDALVEVSCIAYRGRAGSVG